MSISKKLQHVSTAQILFAVLVCIALAAVIFGVYSVSVPYSREEAAAFDEFVQILEEVPALLRSARDANSAQVADDRLRQYHFRITHLIREVDQIPHTAKTALATKYGARVVAVRNAYGQILNAFASGSLDEHASGVLQKHMLIFANRKDNDQLRNLAE